ncbi:ABC transporter ATP-binding protein [Candidatus Dependentiae bacterium]
MIKKLRILLSRREKKILFLLLGASFFVSFLETFSISLVMIFATLATNFDYVFKNKYFNYTYNFCGSPTPSNFVIYFGLALIAFYFFRAVVISGFNYMMSRFSQGRFKTFAFRFFQNYLNFKYEDFASNNSSKIGTVIFANSSQLSQITLSVLTIFSESITISLIYFTLLWVNWKMTMVLTILLGAKIVFIVKTFSKRLAKAGKMTQKLNIELSKTFGESFWNFKLIKLFGNERAVLKRFDSASQSLVKMNTLNTMLQSSPRIILETMGFSILISIIIYVLYRYNNASNVIPVVSMYAFAFYRFLPCTNKVLSEYNRITFIKHSLDSMQNFLSYNLEDLGNEKIEFKNQISLKDVSFAYDEKNKILKNVDLIITRGQKTAFIGESGAGKSTIVDVIIGLFKPTAGNIFIDDQKITKNNVKCWRKMIGYIPQNIYLFDGTIAQNIVFGREYSEQRVIEVLKKANIYKFLLKKGGIHSSVGEGGVNLSGGQKQRIAIARALYSDPDVLVLDEATSALDHETESNIMNEIYSLNQDKTLIVVAHRLSTVKRCDVVYKIENGNVNLVNNLDEIIAQSYLKKENQKQI